MGYEMSDKDDLKAFEEAIFADAEFWDNEELSIKEAFLKKPVKSSNIRKAIDKDKKEKTQLISIRLPVSLIENLKTIGEMEKIGYQTLSRNILQRFVDAENRKQINKLISENRKLEKEIEEMRVGVKRLKQA